MKKVMMMVVTLLLVSAATAATTERTHSHAPRVRSTRPLAAPLEFNFEKDEDSRSASLEELFEQQAAIQTSAGLSDAGPLTNADFGGEKPYEEETIEGGNAEVKPSPVDIAEAEVASEYQELETPVDEVVNLQTATTPVSLADGRLVRIPVETNAASPSDQLTSGVMMDDGTMPQLSSPDLPGGIDIPFSPLNPDLQLLQEDEGETPPSGPKPPLEASKVRVASLVGGILSSTLSSVLTRGMQFTSTKSKEV